LSNFTHHIKRRSEYKKKKNRLQEKDQIQPQTENHTYTS